MITYFKQHLYYFFFFPLLTWSQIGIHGDLHLENSSRLGFIAPSLHFVDGVVQSPNNSAQVYLAEGLVWENADHNSHLATVVEHNAATNFIFPLGDGAALHPLAIHNGTGTAIQVQYRNTPIFEADLGNDFEDLAAFHWTMSADGTAEVSLSWNLLSGLNLLTDDLEALRFVGYTGTQWEEIPAQVSAFDLLAQQSSSLEVGSIRSMSAFDLSQYSHLSLASKVLVTDISISEAFSPNGDGINDIWYIHNAARYPKMLIRVYNRWGALVFVSRDGYDNQWNGDGNRENVHQVLPSASYFYQIDLEEDGEIDHQGWVYINY